LEFQNEIKANTKSVDENGIFLRKKSEIIDGIIEEIVRKRREMGGGKGGLCDWSC